MTYLLVPTTCIYLLYYSLLYVGGKHMTTQLHVKHGKVVVSVAHEESIPCYRVQRLATREFNKYRKQNQLRSPWTLAGRETRESGQTICTDYTYVKLR